MDLKVRRLFVYPLPKVVAVEPSAKGRQVVHLDVPGMVCAL